MDRTADLAVEHLVDEAVLLDAAAPSNAAAVTVARKWSPPPV